MTHSTAARGFQPDTIVTFQTGMRPVASTLPATMRVFVSNARQTTVLVDGKPVFLATRALAPALPCGHADAGMRGPKGECMQSH